MQMVHFQHPYTKTWIKVHQRIKTNQSICCLITSKVARISMNITSLLMLGICCNSNLQCKNPYCIKPDLPDLTLQPGLLNQVYNPDDSPKQMSFQMQIHTFSFLFEMFPFDLISLTLDSPRLTSLIESQGRQD